MTNSEKNEVLEHIQTSLDEIIDAIGKVDVVNGDLSLLRNLTKAEKELRILMRSVIEA